MKNIQCKILLCVLSNATHCHYTRNNHVIDSEHIYHGISGFANAEFHLRFYTMAIMTKPDADSLLIAPYLIPADGYVQANKGSRVLAMKNDTVIGMGRGHFQYRSVECWQKNIAFRKMFEENVQLI